MNLKDKLNLVLLEGDEAFKALQKLIKGDKEADKKRKNKVDFLDFIFNKYEKDIAKIEKKYGLDIDDLGELLMKL